MRPNCQRSKPTHGRTAGMRPLAAIVKRSVENELNPGLYAPCCRAAGERAQVFVPERGGDVAIFHAKRVEYFPVVARGAWWHEPEVSVCLAILARHFFEFRRAFRAAKAAFQHRRVLRLGGGECSRGAIRFFHTIGLFRISRPRLTLHDVGFHRFLFGRQA